MYRNKKFVGLIILLLVFSFVMTGCSGSSKTAEAASAAKTDSSLPEVKWTLQTSWSQGWLLHDSALRLAQIMKEMTDGKFVIEVLPAGSIVGSLEVLDATAAGTIDAYHSWTGYWLNRHPAGPLFASVPMGMEPLAHTAWMYAGGGKEMQQELFDELKLPIKVFPMTLTGSEILAHSNRQIKTIEDFNGLKYRAPGWWGEILRGIGVNVTLIPSPELYPAMEKGVLDAVEFCIPYINKQMGFHEVSKFMTGPGMHQPTCWFELGINQKKWDALPVVYQKMLEYACEEISLWSWTTGIVNDIETLKEWESNPKWTLNKVDEDTQHKLRKLSFDYIDKTAKDKNNALFTKAWDSYKKFFYEFNDYEWFITPVRPIVADKERMLGASQ